MKFNFAMTIALSCCLSTTAMAQTQVQVTVENLQPGNGFFLTPFFAGFHDGSFDIFDSGTAASLSNELLAEDGILDDGMGNGLINDFAANGVGQQSVFTNADGFGGAPVIDPGESVSQVFSLDADSRFFSYATMVIPTNDTFFANANALELLDAAGNFNGTQVISLSLADAYDAGTEVNNSSGAAFSNGDPSTDENGVIVRINDPLSGQGDLSAIDGLQSVAGTEIDLTAAINSPFLRITIESVAIPEPSSLALLGSVGLIGLARRRRS